MFVVRGTPAPKGSGRAIDTVDALALLQAIERDRDPQWSLSFVHDAEPKSKSRPRVVVKAGRTMTYTPAESRAAEQHLAQSWRHATQGVTRDGALAVACIFYRPNRQRIDADNLLKLVLDAGTKARVWHDDCQIVTIVSRVELDAERPRTVVCLMPSTSTLDRELFKTRECAFCKKTVTRKSSAHQSPFCSNACAQHASRKPAKCRHCTKEFQREKAGQSYCSRECKRARAKINFAAAVSAGKRRGPPLCESCGERVSRREYKVCSTCSPKGRKKGSKNTERDAGKAWPWPVESGVLERAPFEPIIGDSKP